MFQSERAGCVFFPLQEKHAISPENVKHAESCNYCIHLHHSETWQGVTGFSKTTCFDEYIRISIAHNQPIHQTEILFSMRLQFDNFNVCIAENILYLLNMASVSYFSTSGWGIFLMWHEVNTQSRSLQSQHSILHQVIDCDLAKLSARWHYKTPHQDL